MTRLYIGKIVATHGIKGELRILSKQEESLKPRLFQVGTHLLIDDRKYEIKSYRKHKNYDMVTLDDYQNINDVLYLLKKNVYKEKEEISLLEDEILDEELLEFTVYKEDGTKGVIKDIEKTGQNYKILRLLFGEEEILLPYHKDFIIRLDKKKKELVVKML